MPKSIETVVIGGGQAGLCVSYYLRQRGKEHVVLEQADCPGFAWRDNRWDSFTLVTPNWSIRIPGVDLEGIDPDAFLPRPALLTLFERYVTSNQLPVQFSERVMAVEPGEHGYTVWTEMGVWNTNNVVVATGLYQRPKIPAYNNQFPNWILQLHSGQYRNPHSIPPGAVLVVGSAQSGCQIAEELYQAGRKVYLSVGSAGRVPRRYRGKDTFYWLDQCGFLSRSASQLPSPEARFAGNPHLTGKDGGHTINLNQFAREGVVLLGHLQGVRDGKMILAPDLNENMRKADQFEGQIRDLIDGFIFKNGLDVPEETLPILEDGYQKTVRTDLKLHLSGIRTVIWATGYQFNFDLVKLPVCAPDGYPVQTRGVTAYPGLYFVGLPWLTSQKSGLLLGVSDDADYIAAHIAGEM